MNYRTLGDNELERLANVGDTKALLEAGRRFLGGTFYSLRMLTEAESSARDEGYNEGWEDRENQLKKDCDMGLCSFCDTQT